MKVASLFHASLVTGSALFLCSGGGEHFCMSGVEFTEAWSIDPNNPITWDWVYGPHQYISSQGYGPLSEPLPGFPTVSAASGQPFESPGIQSAVRAVAAWNDAMVPDVPLGSSSAVGPLVPASTFRLTAEPQCVSPSPLISCPFAVSTALGETGIGVDGINRISAWGNGQFWMVFGGPASLAVSLVDTGAADSNNVVEITECDIAINTVGGQFSFVEDNLLTGSLLASNSSPGGGASVPFDPPLGFVDLEGVLVHEFGHFAGLGHSMLDSRHLDGDSLFPSMFPQAQARDFSNVTVLVAGVSRTSSDSFLIGESASSLEWDDTAAIGATYPTPAFDSLGSISGTVLLEVGTSTTFIAGAHIVATNLSDPNANRISTLSYEFGAYTLEGLTPGEWILQVEAVDAAPPSGSSFPTNAYFSTLDLPNFLDLGPSGCAAIVPFITEYWDSAEAFNEPNHSAATPITLVGGQDLIGIDFLCIDDLDGTVGDDDTMLQVGVLPPFGPFTQPDPSGYSPRGLDIDIASGSRVRFQVTDTPGWQALLLFHFERELTPLGPAFDEQLTELPLATAVSLPVGMLDPVTGVAFYDLPLSGGGYGSYLFQALSIGPLPGQLRFSNVVNVWVNLP